MSMKILRVCIGVVGVLVAGLCGAGLGQTPTVERVETVPALRALRLTESGRVLTTASNAVSGFGSEYAAQWPGSYFETAFIGPKVFFRVGSNHAIFHVVVDGAAPLVLSNPAAGVYRVAGLGEGGHSVKVLIVSENQGGPNVFGGFAIAADGKPLLPKTRSLGRSRQIEFIGDSHTVGYGNTSATRSCPGDGVWAATDDSKAFGALTANHYQADYQINAISGRGIVRNYNGFQGDTVPVVYPYVLFDKKQVYADPTWKPQVIVIALGTNDFSTPLNPGEKWKTRAELHKDYEATYVAFLKSLRAKNPGAYFILWATAATETATEEGKVMEQMKANGETKIALVPIEGLQFTACDYHPSLADDGVIRDKLEKAIDAMAGVWQGK
jgi:lysophospholipase L1-like esterase